MKESKIFTTTIGGREVSAEIGGYCSHSNGQCILRCGDTVVMTNVTMSDSPREGIDFFPLGCDFEEKMYAVGKIPGGFKKREGRPSDKGILTCRLIDRPLRPLFPKGLYNDVAVVATALSVDPNIPPEIFGMIGSSIALTISDIPWNGPTGSVVVGYVDGEYVINPDSAQRAKSKLSLSLSGTSDAIMMVEAHSSELSEEEMLNAILFGHQAIKEQCAWIADIQKAVGKPKKDVELRLAPAELEKAVTAYSYDKVASIYDTFDRSEREVKEDAVTKELMEHFKEIFPDEMGYVNDVIYSMKKDFVRKRITKDEVRPDGRKLDEIRDIWSEIGLLPRVHGSAVFTRGQTQSLTTLTLGTMSEVQRLDGLDDEEVFKRYMHQYNMPGYSTGEAKPMRSPGRREIGHGSLAEKALEPVLPNEDSFPYAIRVVSEIISSNGSTSQASVCASSLALMDAGVPIKAPVAGIAMGLIQDPDTGKISVMSDIQGLEDFYGDMDFKVAGTKEGITAIQMDIKIKGIEEEVLRQALAQAKVGRFHILDKMSQTIQEPRTELSKYAPKIISFNIHPDKIREVIGSGGKVINKIIEDTGVKIDLDDFGKVFIASTDADMAAKAKKIVLSIANDPEVGDEIEGEIVKIMTFGAFLEIAPNKNGLIHISKLSNTRVNKVEDVVNIGDTVKAQVIKVSEKGIDLRLIQKM